MAMGVLVSVGCDLPLSPEAQSHLDASVAAYDSGDAQGTVRNADAVLAETKTGLGASKARYMRALGLVAMRDYNRAGPELEKVRASGYEELRIKANDTLGEIAYLQGRDDQARAYFKEALRGCAADVAPAGHANYRLGCLLQRVGDWTNADLHFQRVTYYFPKTKMAARAKQRVRARAWTVQVGAYHDSVQARTDAKKFARLNIPVRVEPVLRDGKLVYLLQTGRWPTFAPAVAKLPAVRNITSDAFLAVTR